MLRNSDTADSERRPSRRTLRPRQASGRVVDEQGQPIGGVCVVLNHWHCHTNPRGFFHWPVTAALPYQVTLRVGKRYVGQYELLKTTVALGQLEHEPITLRGR